MSAFLLTDCYGSPVLIRVAGLPLSWSAERIEGVLKALAAGQAVVVPPDVTVEVVPL